VCERSFKKSFTDRIIDQDVVHMELTQLPLKDFSPPSSAKGKKE